MVNVTDKTKCTGCTACASVCPAGAITMDADEEGFLYPQVNAEKCSGCGLCDRICPVQKSAVYAPQQARKAFLIKHTDDAIRADSTSGGFFTPMAEWTFQQGGAVCAATFDNEFRVVHAFAESGDDLHHFRGSKYVQSDLNDCFVRIRDMLKAGRIITFVGTPCQVYGLKAFLGSEYDHLYTVDLVCHGVPSPRLWDVYLQYQQRKYRSRVKDVAFRSKIHGYHSGSMRIRFSNGQEYIRGSKVDPMLRSFYGNLVSRPSCYACPFKELERCADFSIYDTWHASKLLPEIRKESSKGFTNVIAHTQRAAQIIRQLPGLCIFETDVEKAVALDGKMVRESAVPHSRRDTFYQDLSVDTLALKVQACVPVSVTSRLLCKARNILYRLGILRLVRKFRKALKR